MVLSDRTIERLIAEGRIAIDPYDVSLLQPSSVDVRVDRYFRVFHNARYPYIDVKLPQEELTEQVEIDDDRPFILHPGEFVLGSTLERVRLPDDLVARLEGKRWRSTRLCPTPSGWTTIGELRGRRPRLHRGRPADRRRRSDRRDDTVGLAARFDSQRAQRSSATPNTSG